MAQDPDPIKLRIETESDTSGIDAAQEKLEGFNEEAWKAQADADVAAVLAKRNSDAMTESAERQAESLREIAEAAQRIVAAQLAQAIGQIAQQFSSLGPEADMAVQATSNFLNVFATTGNPILASLALTTTAIGHVVTAYKEAGEQSKASAAQQQEAIKKTSEARALLVQQIRAEGMEQFFQRELNVLDKQAAAMERMARVRASERDLQAAQQAASSASALNAGGSAAGASATDAAADLALGIERIGDKLKTAAEKVANLEQQAGVKELQVAQLVAAQGSSQQELDAAAAEAQKLRDKASEAAANLAADQQIAGNTIAAMVLGSKTQINEAAKAGADELTAAASNMKSMLETAAREQGAAMEPVAKRALGILTDALADKVVTPDEVQKVKEAFDAVAVSRLALDNEYKRGLAEQTTINDTLLRVIPQMAAKIEAQAGMMKDFEQKFTQGR